MQKDIDRLIRRDAVHRDVYTDPEIFALEMERIFGRTWVYLGHDCEISQDGDYKTTTIGTHPVIVARLAEDGHAPLIKEICGLPPATYFAGPRLRWLLDHVPGAREGAEAGEVLFGGLDVGFPGFGHELTVGHRLAILAA